MDDFFGTFIKRPGKSIASSVVIFLCVVTMIKYQELEVTNFKTLFEHLTDNQSNNELLKTWFANLVSFATLVVLGHSWIKDGMRESYYDSNPVLSQISCAFVGLIFWLWAINFLLYISFSLIAVVILAVFMFVVMWSNKR